MVWNTGIWKDYYKVVLEAAESSLPGKNGVVREAVDNYWLVRVGEEMVEVAEVVLEAGVTVEEGMEVEVTVVVETK